MPIPRFIVRATLKRDLPKVMQAVRERAEAALIANPEIRFPLAGAARASSGTAVNTSL